MRIRYLVEFSSEIRKHTKEKFAISRENSQAIDRLTRMSAPMPCR